MAKRYYVIMRSDKPCLLCKGLGSRARMDTKAPLNQKLPRYTCSLCEGTGKERKEVLLQDALNDPQFKIQMHKQISHHK